MTVSSLWTILPALAAALAAPSSEQRGDVAIEISSREVHVGEPVVVQIAVINAEDHDPPTLPELSGVTVRQMRPSSQFSMINGVTERKVVYGFQLIPRRPGRIEIPPVSVRIDGRILKTASASVLVTDTETSDVLHVQLVSPRKTVYLGESLEVTLEIWLRPYRDRNVRMDAGDMLARVDFDNGQWGAFHDTVIRLRNRELRWQYREDTRIDAEGHERAYFIYPIKIDYVPTRTGPLDVGEIGVLVSYPTRTGRSDDLFSMFNRFQVTRARSIRQTPAEPEIQVLSPPAEGRPEHFNGAVGRFAFTASSNATRVRVREPIELTLTITGLGVLDRVPPPPLASVEALTRDFRVPTDTLAGVVTGNRKEFVVRIGAKHADVTEIPALPFSFFDPENETYVTRWSAPIPLEVGASEQVSISQFVDDEPSDRNHVTRLTETAVGIRANYVEPGELLAQQNLAPSWGSLLLLGGSPLAYLALVLAARRHRRRSEDQAYVRRRRAASTALRNLDSATNNPEPVVAASQAAAALVGYVADRTNAPPGLTRNEVVDLLRRHGVADDRVQLADTLLHRCETLQYAGGAAPSDLPEQVTRCVKQLEEERF